MTDEQIKSKAGGAGASSEGASGYTGVGALLRASRMRCGEDLRDVSGILRIRYVYLDAIEEGRFKDLPGATYAVGFVRAYAEYLGLDAEEVVRRFKQEASSIREHADLVFPSPLQERSIPGGAIILIGLLIALGIYGAWYVGSARDGGLADLVPALPERLTNLLPGNTDPAPASSATEADAAAPAPTPEVAATDVNPPAEDEGPVQSDAASGDAVVQKDAVAAPEPVVKVEPVVEAPEAKPVPPTEPKVEEVAAAPVVAPVVATPAEPTRAPTPSEPAPTPEVTAAPAPAPAPAVPERANEFTGLSGVGGVTPKPKPDAPAEVATVDAADDTPDQTPPVTTTDTAASNPDAPASPAETSAPQQAALPPAAPEATDPDEPRVYGATDESSRILLKAKADSWVQIRDGESNQLLMTRVLRAGEAYRVPDRQGLTLLTGNAGGLEIVVDGTTAPPLGPEGSVRRDVALDTDRLLAGTAVR